MWKCSRVCGITDSSAATTSSTASMPWAPASMLRTKRSWPGTSMNEATAPPPRSRWAKPEVDGDPALLLLLQPVGVGAGERAHERALAVVDVAGGADDERAQAHRRRSYSSRVVTPKTASAVLCSLAARASRASFSVRTMNE